MNLTSHPYGAKVALLAQRVGANRPENILLGPHRESLRLVAEAAQLAGRPREILRKVRTGNRQVEVSLPINATLRDGPPLTLNDFAPSALTVVRAIERLIAVGTRAPVRFVIHAL